MKKVLIISYYWPPAGGISVLRSLKIAKYLSEYGWQPIVYTIENAQYPILDQDNFKHVSSDLIVLRQPAFEPFSIYKKLTGRKKNDTMGNVLNSNHVKTGVFHKLSVWIRANFFIPDARSFWVKPSVKYLHNYLKNNKVDAIFSNGPPHTNTLIASCLSKKTGIPWLMDWQDPWTQVDYYSMFPISKSADRKHKRLERECLNQASAMTIVSPTWKKDAESIGAKNVSVVYWGYDDDDFDGITPYEHNNFIISHFGLMGEDRNPGVFLKAIRDLKQENTAFSISLKIIFAGSIDASVRSLIEKYELLENTDLLDQIPRSEALCHMMSSQIQLLLLNKADNVMGRVPGKLFENMRARAPILCLGPKTSDVGKLINETASGTTLDYEDYFEIKNHLLTQFKAHCDKSLKIKQNDISDYSIQKMTGKISRILDSIVNN